MSACALVVLEPGLLTTVQDLGRPGRSALGVAPSGAADPLSLVLANRLVGNPDGAAALETTLTGAALRSEGPSLVALTGAPTAAVVEGPGGARPVPFGAPVPLRPGEVLRLSRPGWGVRGYVAVAGGLAVPPTLGSASTQVAASLGGTGGGPLRAGERLPVGIPTQAPHAALRPAEAAEVATRLRRPRVRATLGPHAGLFAAPALATLWSAAFTVLDRSDRTGLRLQGPAAPPPGAGVLTTEGLPVGAVQVAGAGEALVLLVDGPPTGGYACPLCVAAVDLPRLGQARPHETLGFERVEPLEALEAWRAQRRWLDALRAPVAAPPRGPEARPA